MIWQSHHEKWLESEIADLKKRHEKQLADLKESHKAEMDRLLVENARLQSEVDRIRLHLGQPGTREPVEEPEKPQDPDAMPSFMGLPFERAIQREEWMNSPAGKRWMEKNWHQTKIPEKEIENVTKSG